MGLKAAPTLVVGAGPAGLAVGRELTARGLPVTLLDRADRIGASWDAHYDRLRLNTVRWLSALPGRRIPRGEGRYVTRDAYVRYLRDYAARLGVPIELGVEVEAIEPGPGGYALATSRGERRAQRIVVATGPCSHPVVPEWPGRDGFAGTVVHSSAYRNAGPYRGLRVLVVGGGNSAADIALDLLEGGAASVALAVRTPPQLLPRTVLGIPTQALGVATRRLPARVTDPLFAWLRDRRLPRLDSVGVPRPALPISRQFAASDVVPVIDAGFARTLATGAVRVVGPVAGLDGSDVVLADGIRLPADVVIAATGYRNGLDALVGHLGVLDERGRPVVHGAVSSASAPGLFFIGFTNPLSGNLRELALDARRIARAIARASIAHPTGSASRAYAPT